MQANAIYWCSSVKKSPSTKKGAGQRVRLKSGPMMAMIRVRQVRRILFMKKGGLETALAYAYTSVRDLPPDRNATFGIDCDGKSVPRSAIARIEFLQPGQM